MTKAEGLEARFRAPFIDSDGRCDAVMGIENDRNVELIHLLDRPAVRRL